MTATSCSSGDEGASSTTASTVASLPAPPTGEECDAAALDAVSSLQDFVDRYDDFTVAEWNALDPPADLDAVQLEVVEIAQAAVDRGCDAPAMEDRLAEAIAGLDADGEVGRSIAAALRGDGPLLGPPVPIIESTVPRDELPTSVTLAVGASLPDLMARLAPGSTIRFAAGTHEFSETIVVDMDLRFEGAGAESTVLSSTAQGAALAFVGPGGFALTDLTVEHVGETNATVLTAIEGPLDIDGSVIRGGVEDPDEGGGHGIAFAFDNRGGLPDRTDAERQGELTVTDTLIADNESAGVLVTGGAAPTLAGLTVARNGGCGICYTETSGGTLMSSTIDANEVGIQVADDSGPTITDTRVVGNATIGISIHGTASPLVSESTIEENGEIGVQVAGSATPVVSRNTIRKHAVGVLATGTVDIEVSDNGVVDHEIGIQAGAESSVDSLRNTVWLSSSAAISYSGSSSGTIRDNRIDRAADVAIQAVDDARTVVVANLIENDGAIGVSFVGRASGTVERNEIIGRTVGVQVGGQANARIDTNVVTDSVDVGILFAEEAAGDAVDNDISGAGSIAILAGGSTVVSLTDNRLTGNETGVVIRDDAATTLAGTTIDTHAVGLQVLDRAVATVERNSIRNSRDVGAVFGGSSSGLFNGNTLDSNGDIGVQIDGSASPRVIANDIEGDGSVAVLYRESSRGEFRGNVLTGYEFGVQVAGVATPGLFDNEFEQIDAASIVFAETAGGTASGNACATSGIVGINIAATATPEIGDNGCTVNRAT